MNDSLLIEYNIDPQDPSYQLYASALARDRSAVLRALRAGGDPNWQVPTDDSTALHLVACNFFFCLLNCYFFF